MLSNAYFLAKFRFDTAENEPAKNLQNFANFANFAKFANFATRPWRPDRTFQLRTGPSPAPARMNSGVIGTELFLSTDHD